MSVPVVRQRLQLHFVVEEDEIVCSEGESSVEGEVDETEALELLDPYM